MNEVKMIQNLNLSTLMENVAEKAQAFYDVSKNNILLTS